MILHEFLFKYGPGGADEFMQVLTVSGHTKNPHHRKQSIYWPKLTKVGSAHNASVRAHTHTQVSEGYIFNSGLNIDFHGVRG